MLAEAERALGEPGRARAALDEAVPAFESSGERRAIAYVEGLRAGSWRSMETG